MRVRRELKYSYGIMYVREVSFASAYPGCQVHSGYLHYMTALAVKGEAMSVDAERETEWTPVHDAQTDVRERWLCTHASRPADMAVSRVLRR